MDIQKNNTKLLSGIVDDHSAICAEGEIDLGVDDSGASV